MDGTDLNAHEDRGRGAVAAVMVFTVAFALAVAWRFGYTDQRALQWDATTYFEAAGDVLRDRPSQLLRDSAGARFLDPAYPVLLSIWMRATGTGVGWGQTLNALLWGISATLLFRISRRWLPPRGALLAGLATAASPILTSFAPCLYSEHTAILGGVGALWTWYGLRDPSSNGLRLVRSLGLAAALSLLVLTKAVFFPFVMMLAAWLWWRRRAIPAAAVSLALLAMLPVQREVQRGGRGLMAASHQIGRVVSWPVPVALRCAVYSLSWHLGVAVFPEVEGACEPFQPARGIPMGDINPRWWSYKALEHGFTYADAARVAVRRPFKYLLVCGTNLLGAAWIEGFYPAAVADLPWIVRLVGWGTKIALSTALWSIALAAIRRSVRRGRFASDTLQVVAPLVYVLAVQANVLGEQRYFYPLLPLLYLLAGQFFAFRPSTDVSQVPPRVSAGARATPRESPRELSDHR